MPLNYRAIQSTMETEEGKKLWYPTLVKNGTVGLDSISKRIMEKSSVTEGDVYNVLRGLISEMGLHLMNGYSVSIDNLGTFTAIIKAGGNGVEDPREVNASQIHSMRIRFTPSYKRTKIQGTTRALYEGVEFQRWVGDPYNPQYLYGKKGQDDGGNSGNGNDDDDYVDPNA